MFQAKLKIFVALENNLNCIENGFNRFFVVDKLDKWKCDVLRFLCDVQTEY